MIFHYGVGGELHHGVFVHCGCKPFYPFKDLKCVVLLQLVDSKKLIKVLLSIKISGKVMILKQMVNASECNQYNWKVYYFEFHNPKTI